MLLSELIDKESKATSVVVVTWYNLTNL